MRSPRWGDKTVDIETLIGETPIRITGMVDGAEEVTITTESGREFVMYHRQDCCEHVYLAEVIGDVLCLVDTPILQARMDTNSDEPSTHEYSEDHLWTFYHISTVKGTVTLRWLGESNGYYGISVDFVELLEDSE